MKECPNSAYTCGLGVDLSNPVWTLAKRRFHFKPHPSPDGIRKVWLLSDTHMSVRTIRATRWEDEIMQSTRPRLQKG